MAENDLNFSISVFGGLNVDDQVDELVKRSHRGTEGGFTQVAPIESPNLKNIDYTSVGIKKRQGSTEKDSLVTIMVVDDVLVKGINFTHATPGDTESQIIVSKKDNLYQSVWNMGTI